MQSCYEAHFPDEVNRHGIFNGLNLAGVDVAHLYLRQEEDPEYSVRRLVEETPGFFSVTVPAQGMPDLLWRYPWLSPDLKGWLPEFGEPTDLAASWVFTFFPVRLADSDRGLEHGDRPTGTEGFGADRYSVPVSDEWIAFRVGWQSKSGPQREAVSGLHHVSGS